MMQIHAHLGVDPAVIMFLGVAQVLYALSFVLNVYLYTLPTNFVADEEVQDFDLGRAPPVLLLYPVLRETESTMRTTMMALASLDYPPERRRVVAVCNDHDTETLDSLERLRREFSFLEILATPPTTDLSWNAVWHAWERNPNAYWWHRGPYAKTRDLPPKKTRQLIHAIYTLAQRGDLPADLLVNYIDADSCPPRDHFRAGAAGMARFDVLQAQNVAGNLNASLPAAWHAFDHMTWDGDKYAHLSAGGGQPFWVLGKGLFLRMSDLLELGGFHPWIAIEDPEVGMRFWAAGRRLGILSGSLVEEVPVTLSEGIKQRRRWVCGFFQSLDPEVMGALDLNLVERVRAWLIFAPCLSLWINAFGAPAGVWGLWLLATGADLPRWLVYLCSVNLVALTFLFTQMYVKTWRRSRLVLEHRRDRILYILKVNPLFVFLWWMIWLAPLAAGFWMYMTDGGLIWRRTFKADANHDLVRGLVTSGFDPTAAYPAADKVAEGG